MYFCQVKCCFYTQNGCMNKKILQRLILSQIPDRFSKLLRSLKTFDVMGPHQGFIYMLLTFILLKLFRKPVVLLCDILMLYL
jgi:hypothetical protein